MPISAGDKAPSVTFKTMSESGPADLPASELFAGKKVVLFAVPGAFTPTCSVKHLPSFIQKADEIRAKGVDAIACVAVNDAFVMGAWGAQQGAEQKVTMLADGNAEFAKACGLEMDATKAGLGTRMKRCAMIVNDGVVEKVFVEEPGQYEKSSAENVLANL